MPCFTDATILAYFRGELDGDATMAVEVELDTCSLCRELMLLVAAEWRNNDGVLGDALRAGTKIGRYEIAEALGAGAMGVVYRAHDPALAREVALKVMARPSPILADRLRSEAQAMARLSHRHVVPVFDVGAAGNQTYVAMGLVRGETLRAWLAVPRKRADILERFAQAAEGLAAAHDAGIVHRDFKPDNVLVAHDGHVQVSDFGLAVAHDGDGFAEGSPAGTPAYLAPEVRASNAAGPAGDQYSFFVALHEAITGARPERVRVKLRPRRLARAIARGLEHEPAKRHASMHAVARELRAIARAPMRIAIAGAAAVAASAIVIATFGVARKSDPCASAGTEIAAVWSAQRATELRTTFARIPKPYAADTATAAIRLLDRYTSAWRASAVGACRATHVDGVQSSDLLDRRISCLAGRRAELAAVVARVVAADDKIATRAVTMIDRLASPGICDDIAVLGNVAPPPRDPALAHSLAALRDQRAEVKASLHAGTFEQGLSIARAAAAAARTTDYKPIIAETLESLGGILISAGKPDEALPLLDEALLAAEASRHTYASIAIRIHQVELLGVTLGRYDEARRIAVLGRATAEGIGASRLTADFDMQLGIIDSDRGHHAEALAEYERALPVFLQAHGEDAADTGHLIGLIGITLDDLDRHPEAIAKLEQAVAIHKRAYGPGHPNVANTISNLASHLHRGDAADKQRALELTREAHRIRLAALSPDHKELAMSWSNLGAMLRVAGDLAGAKEHIATSLAIKERTLGRQHPSTGVSYLGLAEVVSAQGDHAASLEHTQHAIAAFVGALGEAHAYTVKARTHLGATLMALHRPAEAVAVFELIMPHLAAAPDRYRTLFNLAEALADTHRDLDRVRALLAEAHTGAVAAKDQVAIDAIDKLTTTLRAGGKR